MIRQLEVRLAAEHENLKAWELFENKQCTKMSIREQKKNQNQKKQHMQTVVCERCQRMRKKSGWVRWVVVRWYSKLLYARHSVWGHEAVSLGRASVARLHPACCLFLPTVSSVTALYYCNTRVHPFPFSWSLPFPETSTPPTRMQW